MAQFIDNDILSIGSNKWDQKLSGYSAFASAEFNNSSFMLPSAENVSLVILISRQHGNLY
jgi:hypothetical protein